MAEYKVQFEVFEGPLDLLLYLIKKEEVDIYEVNLTKLATQFIEYIDTMRLLDLEVAGEFVVMASTLMYIKSRELLPVDQQAQVEGEEEGEDPRWELIRQLVEYKKFKDAAAQLQALESRQDHVFPRRPGKLSFVDSEEVSESRSSKPEATIFDLLNAVNSVLKRFEKREGQAREIFEDKWSVSEKIESIIKVIGERGPVKFSDLFENVASRAEVVCTFLALLELIRLKQLVCVQPEAFGEIEIARAELTTEVASTSAEAEATADRAPLANESTEPVGAGGTLGPSSPELPPSPASARQADAASAPSSDSDSAREEVEVEDEEEEDEFDDDDDDDEFDDEDDDEDDEDDDEEGDGESPDPAEGERKER